VPQAAAEGKKIERAESVLVSSSRVSYTAPSPGPVLFSVDANAAVPMSGRGTAPSEIGNHLRRGMKDVSNQPLAATAGATTDVTRIDFTDCT
jgi:hypothetical protein